MHGLNETGLLPIVVGMVIIILGFWCKSSSKTEDKK